MLLLTLLLVAIPVVEIYVIVQVGHAIGALATIVLLLLGSLVGIWLVKREGLGVLRRIDVQLRDHQVPHREMVDGFLILLAGLLIAIPGFVTDGLGFLLLLPPVRAVVRRVLFGRFQSKLGIGWLGGQAGRFGSSGRVWVDSHVIDVERPSGAEPTSQGSGDVPPDNSGPPAELPPGRY